MTAAALALALVAVLVGAVVQSAVGFGFAIIAAPVLAATAGPEKAAPTLALVGVVVSSLTLLSERRPREVLAGPALALTLWSLPGMAAGALVLTHAPEDALRVLVAVAVLGAVVVQIALRRRARTEAAEPPAARTVAAAGALSGALATSTGLNGPPLVLVLLGRATPAQARDTLAVVFLAAALLGGVTLAVAGQLEPADGVLAMVVVAAAGQAIGRRAFRRLHAHHELLSLAVLALGAAVALVVAVQAATA